MQSTSHNDNLLENVTRLIWFMVSGAFIFGAWSATLEFRTQDHGDRVGSIEKKYEESQQRVLEVLGRMDERLKNIEQSQRRNRRDL